MLRLPDPEQQPGTRTAVPQPKRATAAAPSGPPRRRGRGNPLLRIAPPPEAGDGPPADADAPAADPSERATPGGYRPECYACPVGEAFMTVRQAGDAIGGAGPETVDHLVSASRELVAAARSFLEIVEHRLDRPPGPACSRARRVPLDAGTE